jgi:hypothetical protein
MIDFINFMREIVQFVSLKSILIGLSLLLLSNLVYGEFSINYAQTRLVDNLYLLDARLNYELPEIPLEALQNGVALTFVITILVERERWYMWDERIAALKQRYQLKYHAFSKQYVLTYLNTGIQETFPTLEAILTQLGRLEDFPLLDKHLVEANEVYWVHLQTYLDIESLPVPLRPIAYLSSQWHLNSNWYLCPLQFPKSEPD